MYNAQDYRVRNSQVTDGFGPRHRVYQAPVPVRQAQSGNSNARYYQKPTQNDFQAARFRQVDGSRPVQSHRQPPQQTSDHMVQGDRNPNQGRLQPTYKFGGGVGLNDAPPPCPNPLKGNVPDPAHSGKILICHVPPGNPSNPQTLSIDPSGLNGHSNDCLDYDGPCNPPSCTFGAPDCNGVCGGPSIRDCKGVCYDPTKTSPPNVVDCAGVCGGSSEFDCAGNCFDPTKTAPPVVRDCKGVCGGTSVPDCKGVCGGTSVPDCKGVCGGTAVQDCKGVCGGTATIDCKGVCGGTAVRDCNGVCEGTAFKDCNGRCVTSDCTFNNSQKPHAFRPAVQSSRPMRRFAPKNE